MQQPATAPAEACVGARGDAFALAEGELAREVAAALRAHAQACRSCRDALATDDAFLRFLRAPASHAAAPFSLRARLGRLLDRAEAVVGAVGRRGPSGRGD
jgi:hypothetical protein